MIRSIWLACLAIPSAVATPALAQEPFALDEIVVSGGLTPIETSELGRSVSVVTAQDIEERGIATVQDALRGLPGVAVNGSSSTLTQVRIRGAEANSTLILIDGIEAAGGDGEYILSGIETANIERIEVLRGPQSVYYGSDAAAGVINIITRRGGLGRTLSGTVEVGDALTASAFAAYRTERGGVSLALSYTDDDGYDQSGDSGEKDGLERRTAILSGDYLVTEDLRLGLTLRRSLEDYDSDITPFTAMSADEYVVDDPNERGERDETTAGVFAEYSMLDERLMHRLAYEKTDNKQSYNTDDPTETDTEALKYRLSLGLDGRSLPQTQHLLNILAENETDSSSSNPGYDRESNSLAVEYRGSFDNGFAVQLGARYDDNDVFKDATTWTVGLAYSFAESGVKLHASAGTGIVNPSYFELYADSFGYAGNPGLKPEKNESYDVGVEVPVFGLGSIDVTYFNETLTDEITAVGADAGTFSFINQSGESDREGVEIAGNVQATDTLRLRLAYTRLNAKNPDGTVEVRRPENELALGATLDVFEGRGSVTADARHVSGNYDSQFFGTYETKELPDFTTLDLAAEYALTDTLSLTGRVSNLFDVDATEVWGYATRGRAGYVGLRASF